MFASEEEEEQFIEHIGNLISRRPPKAAPPQPDTKTDEYYKQRGREERARSADSE